MLGFETRYDEAQRHSYDLARSGSPAPRKRNMEVSDFVQVNLEQREIVRERLQDGYVLPFAREIGGRVRQPFREEGFRTDDNLVLKYFVTLVPRRGRARASMDKATLAVQCYSKMLTLDYPYVELNRTFMAALRVDCDGVFVSAAACLDDLKTLVCQKRLPCLPHIVVGDLLDDGRFVRPHFIWLLPYGMAVWRSDDERCRSAPVRLFDAVCRGLVDACLEIGADAAAPTMTMRMKNPISPLWHTITPNQNTFPTLTEYSRSLNMKTSRAKLARQAAAIQSGLGLIASNALFDPLREEGKRLLIKWHVDRATCMTGTRDALADHLHEALIEFAKASGLSDTQVGYVSYKVANYLAHDFDANKVDRKQRNRHRLLGTLDNIHSVVERQAVGGRYAAKANAERTLKLIVDAYQRLLNENKAVNKSALARESGVSRRTVINRWADVLEAVGEGCEKQGIDKKTPAIAPQINSLKPKPYMHDKPWPQANVANGHRVILSDDDDHRLIEEQEAWIASQEGRQGPLASETWSDAISVAERHLTALETA